MRRLFALLLVMTLWFNFAPEANALGANLVPCKDSPAFQELALNARNTTTDPESGKKRFERYSQALCGPEGYPHLIVDGSLDHAGDFLIPRCHDSDCGINCHLHVSNVAWRREIFILLGYKYFLDAFRWCKKFKDPLN